MNDTTTKQMPVRQRFLDICHGKRLGDVSLWDWCFRTLVETPEEWVKQGAPEGIRNPKFYNRLFRFEHINPLQEIIASTSRSDIDTKAKPGVYVPPEFYPTPPIVPVFTP